MKDSNEGRPSVYIYREAVEGVELPKSKFIYKQQVAVKLRYNPVGSGFDSRLHH